MTEYGNGYVDGKPMYYEQQDDRLDIFPGGLPRGHHKDMPHGHIVVNNDGGVEFMREGGEIVNDYRGYNS